MVIDIIDMEDEQYANLSSVQLAMVRAAQAKKNKIVEEAEEQKAQLFRFMLSDRAARSSALRCSHAEVDAQTEEEIARIKADLNYQLAYEAISSEGNDKGPYRYPENPNYNLAYSQRFLVVRNYYMDATEDPEARLQAYSMDTLAREYLGEYYQTLYELFASYCE